MSDASIRMDKLQVIKDVLLGRAWRDGQAVSTIFG